MSKPDPADVLVARAADRLALIDMRGDAEAALAFCRELHDLRAEVTITLRSGSASLPPRVRQTMPARFAGRCAKCGGTIRVGEAIFFDHESRTATHAGCS